MRLYLQEAGAVPLLTAADEVRLQGHLVFGWELHTGAKTSKRVLFCMGSCLPGTPRMSQNPLLR
jgi:Sigma-70 factor, region 1.2